MSSPADRPMLVLTAVVSLIFLASGTAKLIPADFETAAFMRWGYPLWFMTLTGALEVAGGAALWIPRLRALAAPALALLMTGAIATHLVNAEWPMSVVASAIFVTTSALAWRRRAELRALPFAARLLGSGARSAP